MFLCSAPACKTKEHMTWSFFKLRAKFLHIPCSTLHNCPSAALSTTVLMGKEKHAINIGLLWVDEVPQPYGL